VTFASKKSPQSSSKGPRNVRAKSSSSTHTARASKAQASASSKKSRAQTPSKKLEKNLEKKNSKSSSMSRLARATGADLLLSETVGHTVKNPVKTLSKSAPSKGVVKARSSSTKSARAAKVAKTAKDGRPAKAVKAAPVKSGVKATLKKTASKPAQKTASARPSTKPVKASRRAPARVETPVSLAADIMAEAMMHAELTNEDAMVERAAAREERMREILSRLAVSSNRFDEMPNLELAAEIVSTGDRDAIGLLVTVLERADDVHGPDAGRVLAEVGLRARPLLLPEVARLVALVSVENVPMMSSVLTALSPLGDRVVDELWDMRDLFWQIVNDGQTEADAAQAAAVKLLACMCAAGPDFARTLAGGLVDLLGKCLAKDVALYAEAVLPALGAAHSHRAKPVLDRRMKELSPAEVARLRRAVRMAQQGGIYSVAA